MNHVSLYSKVNILVKLDLLAAYEFDSPALPKKGAVSTQKIESLKILVLVVHHKNDAFNICVPSEAGRITADLKSSPIKKFIMVAGGSDPEGDPCAAKHWHGFINYEKETIKVITDWIKSPQS